MARGTADGGASELLSVSHLHCRPSLSFVFLVLLAMAAERPGVLSAPSAERLAEQEAMSPTLPCTLGL